MDTAELPHDEDHVDFLGEEVDDLLNLDEENEEDSIEYKRTLSVITEDRLQQLASQMQRRMKAGNGSSTYVLGVDDNGTPVGLTRDQMELSHVNLGRICDQCDYTMSILIETQVPLSINVYMRKYLIRENNLNNPIDIRVGLLGNVDAGKSTIVGVLTTGRRDNGRGLARAGVLTHNHEMERGMTSDISQKILGFSPNGTVVNYDEASCMTDEHGLNWKSICEKSGRIINFIDLAGHLAFSKTTIGGIAGYNPDYAMLLVNSNGFSADDSTIEHIRLCYICKVPIVLVLTKVDMPNAEERLKTTYDLISKVLTSGSSKKRLIKIGSIEDIINVVDVMNDGYVIPVFKTSSVTGEGIGLLKSFLNLCNPRVEYDSASSVRFNTEKVYRKIKGAGVVIGGVLDRGTVHIGKTYYIGPFSNQSKDFIPVKIRTMEVKRVRVNEATAGRYVCLGITGINPTILRKGITLVDSLDINAIFFLECSVVVRDRKTITIKEGFSSTLIEGMNRVSVTVIKIGSMKTVKLRKSQDGIYSGTLKSGDRGTITLRLERPIYIEKNDRILLTEGLIRVVGRVTKIYKSRTMSELKGELEEDKGKEKDEN